MKSIRALEEISNALIFNQLRCIIYEVLFVAYLSGSN